MTTASEKPAVQNPVAGIDVASVDKALATTRVVRRRLDLNRPVDQEILLDCIDIAEQAPSGGNQGSRRWIIVQDQAIKDRLAELYMEAAGEWMIEVNDRIAGTGHPQERVMASAAYLAQHLAEVPAIVIPTIIGVHDGSGRPGLFDSVIQSVWSMAVALRARGLGSAWTTANLSRQDDIAELLGIPDGMTQIAMVPVAWTKGTEFKMAPRLPAREITYFDGFGRTWSAGPRQPARLADGPGTVVEVDIKAKPDVVWPYLTASDRDVESVVDRSDEPRVFGWATGDTDNPDSRWWFDSILIAGGTRLRYSVVLGPGPSALADLVADDPGAESRIIAERIGQLRQNMTSTIEGIKAAAERDAAAKPK